jgi:hypothetical protein
MTNPLGKLFAKLPRHILQRGFNTALDDAMANPETMRKVLSVFTPDNTVAMENAAQRLRDEFGFSDAEFAGAFIASRLNTWRNDSLWELEVLLHGMVEYTESRSAALLTEQLKTFFDTLDSNAEKFRNILKENKMYEPCPRHHDKQ